MRAQRQIPTMTENRSIFLPNPKRDAIRTRGCLFDAAKTFSNKPKTLNIFPAPGIEPSTD